jgi:branched-subunit amino acid aminotransferase/4-amino-4-deoxychorismate lyase
LHLDRLMQGASQLGIDVARDRVRAAIESTAYSQTVATVLRVTVSRGSGVRGYRPTPECGAAITVSRSELGRNPLVPLPPAVLQTSSVTMAEQPLLAGIKHCNRLEQVLAAAEAGEQGVDDVLLKRRSGYFQCSSNANLFALCDDRLMTPDCKLSGVAGTRRRLLMEQLSAAVGLSVMETGVDDARLLAAEGLCLSNSIIGVRCVARLDARVFAPSPKLLALQKAYFDAAKRCCAD